jgi:glycosyltransferase involved in cell wall biosynthesis
MNVSRTGEDAPRKAPRVSIGLPVYNGERFLEEALRSLLSQTFTDFELIISDNASTDRTAEICKTHASADSRIRYFRSERNLGLAWNWNRVFALSSGEYFRWSAHDDLVDPRFLAAAVKVLDRDPTAVLCYSHEKFIDEKGQGLREYETPLKRAGFAKPQDRFRDLVLIDHLCLPIFGLIRADVLRATTGYGSYVASDRVLLAELSLFGRFHQIPDSLFKFRLHREQSIQALAFHRRAGWIDPANAGRMVFPHWRFYREYFLCLRRRPLHWRERMVCYLHLARWWGVNWNWARMLSDLLIAATPGSLSLLQKIQKRIYKEPKLSGGRS